MRKVFTGLVEATSRILLLKQDALVIEHPECWSSEPIQLGESISVSGCCLTVAEFDEKRIRFDLSQETWNRTAFSTRGEGDYVNLERALKADSRLGGHIVSGHVDAIGTIEQVSEADGFHQMVVGFPAQFASLLVDKGSVCVEGISLTVIDPDSSRFEVAIIPETWKRTNLRHHRTGAKVNLEFDIVAKQIERAVSLRLGPAS